MYKHYEVTVTSDITNISFSAIGSTLWTHTSLKHKKQPVPIQRYKPVPEQANPTQTIIITYSDMIGDVTETVVGVTEQGGEESNSQESYL